MHQPQGQFIVDKPAATATLYRHYAPALLTYLRLHTPSREDAEDLLVDTFLAALENTNFSQLSEVEQRHWLWRVAHNKVADCYRGKARWTKVPLDQIAETISDEEEGAPEELALRDEEYRRLRESIKHLPVLQQQVLRLRFVNGMRCTEIATLMGKRDGTVRMLLSRTLNLLRSLYEKQ
ncbi:MAG: sigma-70 family RNA polymerase sigma factor [Ktedonobacteraceae bacterium]|nr:sigma-70 family RNA polymerase sigma factor [Ktedonobacteraceae bacterium]MBV9709344.1 sigma-70 family RNA polymerase sigma factor [Ktedonobacteraceae bacterium]